MDRKKTNSVTELVKIIAREIVEEHLHDTSFRSTIRKIAKVESWDMQENIKVWVRGFLKNELEKQENNSISETICKVAAKCIEGVDNELKSVSHPWPMEEDIMLQEEMDVAINRIAANHERTIGSIKSRIKQKEILKSLKSQRREGNE